MSEPSFLIELFYMALALAAIFLPLGVVAFVVTRGPRRRGRNSKWSPP